MKKEYPEFPRKSCRESFLTWKWLVGVLIPLIAGVGAISWAGSARLAVMENRMTAISISQYRIEKLYEQSDSMIIMLRRIERQNQKTLNKVRAE